MKVIVICEKPSGG